MLNLHLRRTNVKIFQQVTSRKSQLRPPCSWSGVCAFGNSIHCEQRILIFCTDNLENEAMSLNLNESTTHVKNSYLEHELMVNSAQRCGCFANLSSHLDTSSLQAYRPFCFSAVHGCDGSVDSSGNRGQGGHGPSLP